MSRVRKYQVFIANSLWLFFAEVVNKGLLTFLSIPIVRFIGVDSYGTFSIALSFVSLFTFATDFGFSTLVMREVGKDSTVIPSYLRTGLALKIVLATITIILINSVGLSLYRDSSIQLLIIILSFYISLNGINIFFQSFFRALQQVRYEAFAKVVQGLTLFTLSILAITLFQSTVYVASSFVIATIVALILLFFLVHKRLSSPIPQWNAKAMLSMTQQSWMYGVSGFLALINLNFDAVALSFFTSSTDVGAYSALYRILIALMFAISLIFIPLFPTIARNTDNKGFLKKLNIRMLLLGSVFGLVFVVPTLLFTEQIIQLLYGTSLVAYSYILTILVWVFYVILLREPAGYTLSAIGKQKYYLIGLLVSSVTNVILNLIFVPQYGVLAAAITTLISETLNLIILTSALWIHLNSSTELQP